MSSSCADGPEPPAEAGQSAGAADPRPHLAPPAPCSLTRQASLRHGVNQPSSPRARNPNGVATIPDLIRFPSPADAGGQSSGGGGTSGPERIDVLELYAEAVSAHTTTAPKQRATESIEEFYRRSSRKHVDALQKNRKLSGSDLNSLELAKKQAQFFGVAILETRTGVRPGWEKVVLAKDQETSTLYIDNMPQDVWRRQAGEGTPLKQTSPAAKMPPNAKSGGPSISPSMVPLTESNRTFDARPIPLLALPASPRIGSSRQHLQLVERLHMGPEKTFKPPKPAKSSKKRKYGGPDWGRSPTGAPSGSQGGSSSADESGKKKKGRGWTAEEDDRLRQGVEKLGPKSWKLISADYLQGNRSDVQCLHRWQKVLRPGLKKGPWTPDEDQKIIVLISQGTTKWAEIAEHVEGRSGKQCRERYNNQLDPSIDKSPWRPEEDRIIIEAQAKFGNSWTKIAELLKGRPENMIKNHWNSAGWRKKREAQAALAAAAQAAVAGAVSGVPTAPLAAAVAAAVAAC